VQVRVLGPLSVVVDGCPVEIGGQRLRALISALAIAAPRPASVAGLAAAIWGDEPPAGAANAVQTLVSRARRALGNSGAIIQSTAGYLLAVAPDDVDAHRFAAQVALGTDQLRKGDAAGAADLLRGALDLWRGPVLAEVNPLAAREPQARWEALRLAAWAALMDSQLRIARTSGARQADYGPIIAQLEELIVSHPLHDRFAVLLLDALAAAGRIPEALAAYERMRAAIADELGADPSPALREAHNRLLTEGARPANPTSDRSNLRGGRLPAQVSSFIGRDADQSQLLQLMGSSRLVTLVGPGGAGKTRLACETAAGLSTAAAPTQSGSGTQDWSVAIEGVWLIELAGVGSASTAAPITVVDLAQVILATLNVRESRLERRIHTDRPALDRLEDALADRPALIVLDNCEHLIDAAAELAARLLAECPGLRILATSREPLGINGETVFAVLPLSVPDIAVSDIEDSGAVALFVDRARSASPGFLLDDANAGAVLEICRRLDGLPLALELAAARLRTLTAQQIADRLGDRFALLTGGNRAGQARHRTLRAVVAWSWDLLDEDDRDLVERLSVFAGGISAAAAAAVGAPDGSDMLTRLADLADKSLLTAIDGPTSGEPRFRMLETIREFGVDQLASKGGETEVRAAHAAFFEQLSLVASVKLRGAEQMEWAGQLSTERDNLYGAMSFLATQGKASRALDLSVNLAWYWTLTGSHAVASTWLGVCLAVPGDVDPQLRAVAQVMYGLNSAILGWVGDPEDHLSAGRLVLAGRDPRTQSPLEVMMRVVASTFAADHLRIRAREAADEARARGESADQIALAESAQLAGVEDVDALIDLALETAEDWVAASLLLIRGNLAENRGDMGGAVVALTDALARFQALGERWGIGNVWEALARTSLNAGDLDGAMSAYSKVRSAMHDLGAEDDTAQNWCWSAMALVRKSVQDPSRSALLLEEAREQLSNASYLFARTGSSLGPMVCAMAEAEIARASGDVDAALAICAKGLAGGAGSPWFPDQIRCLLLALEANLLLIDGPSRDPARAARCAADALQRAIDSDDMPVFAAAAVAAAAVLAQRGELALAARALGAAEVARGAVDPTSLDVQAVRAVLLSQGGPQILAEVRGGQLLAREDAIGELSALREYL
jgi:predicted ATPase/DNA-binding SARP family transcriptional activator